MSQLNNNELSDLVSKVKIKVQDFQVNIPSDQSRSRAAVKKERENKKLVSLVSLLTNKLLKYVILHYYNLCSQDQNNLIFYFYFSS